MKVKLFGIPILSIEDKEKEEYEITNADGITMYVNSVNKDRVEDFKRGLNPRCGLPLSQCTDGINHVHTD